MYQQMRIAFASTLFCFLFVIQAQAHTESFRYLQSSENVVFDLQINDESFGKVDTWLGSSNFRYKKSFGNYEIELLDTKLNVIGFYQKPWGANGEVVSVETTSTLKKLNFRRTLGGVRVEVVYEDRMKKPIWLSSKEGTYQSGTDIYIENRSEVIKGGKWISLEEKPFGSVKNWGPSLAVGDRFVLPHPEMGNLLYFHVSSGNEALMLNPETGVVRESVSFLTEKAGLRLSLEVGESVYTYDFLGSSDLRDVKSGKVIVKQNVGDTFGSRVRVASWYRDLVAGPGFQNQEEIVGEYYSSEFDGLYFFRDDQIGGLRFLEENTDYRGFFWSWNYDGEVIRSDRYMNKDSLNKGLGTEEELKTCLVNKSVCSHIDSRSYRLIQVNRRGLLRNKKEYVFLRVMHRPSVAEWTPIENIQTWIKQ